MLFPFDDANKTDKCSRINYLLVFQRLLSGSTKSTMLVHPNKSISNRFDLELEVPMLKAKAPKYIVSVLFTFQPLTNLQSKNKQGYVLFAVLLRTIRITSTKKKKERKKQNPNLSTRLSITLN